MALSFPERRHVRAFSHPAAAKPRQEGFCPLSTGRRSNRNEHRRISHGRTGLDCNAGQTGNGSVRLYFSSPFHLPHPFVVRGNLPPAVQYQPRIRKPPCSCIIPRTIATVRFLFVLFLCDQHSVSRGQISDEICFLVRPLWELFKTL